MAALRTGHQTRTRRDELQTQRDIAADVEEESARCARC
jgi:hypothetical protein